MYLNKVIIIGNITRDPELKALPSGQSVVNFSLATNRVWKDAGGTKQEDVEFHNVVMFGKQADTIKQYCSKGDSLLIEGRIQTRTWETDGKKNHRTEIIAESFQFGNKVKKVAVDDETGEKIPNLDDIPTQRELTEQDKINIKSAESVGQTITDEELDSLASIPF